MELWKNMKSSSAHVYAYSVLTQHAACTHQAELDPSAIPTETIPPTSKVLCIQRSLLRITAIVAAI